MSRDTMHLSHTDLALLCPALSQLNLQLVLHEFLHHLSCKLTQLFLSSLVCPTLAMLWDCLVPIFKWGSDQAEGKNLKPKEKDISLVLKCKHIHN